MAERVIITGGSGFLGTAIAARLMARGFDVVSLDVAPPRDDRIAFVRGDLAKEIPNDPRLGNPHAIIHLAGVPIFGRWTNAKMQAIYDSRVCGTQNLVATFSNPVARPTRFVSASAVGFYGDRGDTPLTVASPAGDGFLALVCRDWETAARRAMSEHAVPTTVIRNAHILGKGGLLGVLVPYFKKHIGGPLGNGLQFMPWIHVDDCAELYVRAALGELDAETLVAAAPEQVRNSFFSKTISEVLGRANPFFIPVWALWLLYGKLAHELVTSQCVEPALAGYQLRFPNLKAALADILRN